MHIFFLCRDGKGQRMLPSAVNIWIIYCTEQCEWRWSSCAWLRDWLQKLISKMLIWRHLGDNHSSLLARFFPFSFWYFCFRMSENLHHHHFLFHSIYFLGKQNKTTTTKPPTTRHRPPNKQKTSKGSHLSFQHHHTALKPFFYHPPCSSEFASSTVPHTNSLHHVRNDCNKQIS